MKEPADDHPCDPEDGELFAEQHLYRHQRVSRKQLDKPLAKTKINIYEGENDQSYSEMVFGGPWSKWNISPLEQMAFEETP